jgi:hypothetical protein
VDNVYPEEILNGIDPPTSSLVDRMTYAQTIALADRPREMGTRGRQMNGPGERMFRLAGAYRRGGNG